MLLQERPATRFDAQDFASRPAEERGRDRADVRLLVARPSGITHTAFGRIADELAPGDIVVVNNSATLAGQLDAAGPRGPVVLNVATPLDDGTYVLEIRTAPDAGRPVLDATAGETYVAGPVRITLLSGYPVDGSSPTGAGNRLWRSRVEGPLRGHLAAQGRPISYG